MRDGYSYTTISADEGGPVRVSVAFRLGGSALVAARVYDGGRRAHLSVELGDVQALISPADPAAVTAQDVRIARHLAGQAAAYADAVERIAAQGEGGPAAA